MIFHFFKTAFRNLRANKVYSVLTVAGLGVGIAVFLVIFLFIRYQESFDGFHSKKANIYRMLTKGDKPGDQALASVYYPLPGAMAHDFPDWKVTGVYSIGGVPVMTLGADGNTEKAFTEKDGVFFVNTSFFGIFDFPLLAGEPDKSLADRSSVVLSKRVAERYFGDWQKAVGRSIKCFGTSVFKVSGILADPPSNTDFKLDLVFPYPALNFDTVTDWSTVNSNNGCYVLLPAGVDTLAADRQLKAFARKYQAPDNKNTQIVRSLGEVHFDPQVGNFSGKTITVARIRSLWLIASFILLIACVNFINIATAQAVNRAKEVGVRKVLGGGRLQLRVQFLLEALLLVVSGVVLAALLVGVLAGPISSVMEIPVSMGLFGEPEVLIFLGATVVAVTLLAGFYPALVLSSFNPITALKTKLISRGARGITLRRGLVVFQFVIAQALIIGVFLIVRQLDFVTHAPMGFDKAAIITVPIPGDSLSVSKRSYLRDRLLAIKDVRMVSYNNNSPASDNNWWSDFKFDHSSKSANVWVVERWADPDYLATYSVPLVAGRNITRNDSILEFLVNETVVRKLGFAHAEDVLNKELEVSDGGKVGKVVGVVRDFHQSTLKDSLTGVLVLHGPGFYTSAGIKMTGDNLPATIAAIRQLWGKVYPEYVFEYQFVDETIANFYKEDAKMSEFYKIFAAIAIFLSCLGLYGLASFMAAQRLKEVGIRKVLGASAGNIVYLFTREFMVLVGIAFLIATPIAWYFVHNWIQQYVFRIPISGWVFVVGGLVALVIALGTVSAQAYRAAAVNPVRNLRTE
ncbi:MAG TPA: ABC transporter permease [Puia sp.]|jgi:predicted permease|nr:ABC transporter permease [Puia sp.]